jgi:hypothetical protein
MDNAKSGVGLIVEAREKALMSLAPRPESLYHYTNAAGLKGIIESKTIWATQFDFLNDRTEFLYAIDVIKGRLEARGDVFSPAAFSIGDIGKTLTKQPHYVASFCEHHDLLSQWRGYAQTNDGYSVGFRFQDLARKKDLARGVDLVQLIYQRSEQDRLLDMVLDAGQEAIDASPGASIKIATATVINLLPFFYRFKHELFSGESEWRLIGSADDVTPEKFRVVGGHFVPYIEFPLEAGDIDLVVQGPGAYRDGNKEAIERFAKLHGFTPTVISSGVPLV